MTIDLGLTAIVIQLIAIVIQLGFIVMCLYDVGEAIRKLTKALTEFKSS